MKRRGRPRALTIGDYSRGPRYVAFGVLYDLAGEPHPRRGALAQAIRQIACEWGMSEETVRQYATRHRCDVQPVAQWLRGQDDIAREWRRRSRDLPPEVRQKLGPFSLAHAVALLRAAGIDHPPQTHAQRQALEAFIAAVRAL